MLRTKPASQYMCQKTPPDAHSGCFVGKRTYQIDITCGDIETTRLEFSTILFWVVSRVCSSLLNHKRTSSKTRTRTALPLEKTTRTSLLMASRSRIIRPTISVRRTVVVLPIRVCLRANIAFSSGRCNSVVGFATQFFNRVATALAATTCVVSWLTRFISFSKLGHLHQSSGEILSSATVVNDSCNYY